MYGAARPCQIVSSSSNRSVTSGADTARNPSCWARVTRILAASTLLSCLSGQLWLLAGGLQPWMTPRSESHSSARSPGRPSSSTNSAPAGRANVAVIAAITTTMTALFMGTSDSLPVGPVPGFGPGLPVLGDRPLDPHRGEPGDLG